MLYITKATITSAPEETILTIESSSEAYQFVFSPEHFKRFTQICSEHSEKGQKNTARGK